MRPAAGPFSRWLLHLAGGKTPDVHACNYLIEERVQPARQSRYETDYAGSVTGMDAWLEAHSDYLTDRIYQPCPETFTAINGDAVHSPQLDTSLHLLRIERLDPALAELGLPLDHIAHAVEVFHNRAQPRDPHVTRDDIQATLKKLAQILNKNPFSQRPRFAALESGLADEMEANDWANRLRNRLGLAHHDPGVAGPPIPVALMRYPVQSVIGYAKTVPEVKHPLTVPTVLDHAFCEVFCPAPKEALYGRTMDLEGIATGRGFIGELLHPRIEYAPGHIYKVGAITDARPRYDSKELRELHILLLREETERHDFGHCDQAA
ncbi:MAG: hypothetical protein HQL96_02215 [Magnetococcales bacterium]|nr:hypothetical protein [Magnetococcales bacterium]